MARETWTWPWGKEGICRDGEEVRRVLQCKHPAVWSEKVKTLFWGRLFVQGKFSDPLSCSICTPLTSWGLNLKTISNGVLFRMKYEYFLEKWIISDLKFIASLGKWYICDLHTWNWCSKCGKVSPYRRIHM